MGLQAMEEGRPARRMGLSVGVTQERRLGRGGDLEVMDAAVGSRVTGGVSGGRKESWTVGVKVCLYENTHLSLNCQVFKHLMHSFYHHGLNPSLFRTMRRSKHTLRTNPLTTFCS